MPKRSSKAVGVLAAFLVVVGCSSVTSVDALRDFSVVAMPDPENLVPGVDATSALKLLYIQGLIRTPSPCYELSGDFRKRGNQLTFTVAGRSVGGTNCDSGVAGYRYTAVVGGLRTRTFQLTVVHDVAGGEQDQFNLSVTVMQ